MGPQGPLGTVPRAGAPRAATAGPAAKPPTATEGASPCQPIIVDPTSAKNRKNHIISRRRSRVTTAIIKRSDGPGQNAHSNGDSLSCHMPSLPRSDLFGPLRGPPSCGLRCLLPGNGRRGFSEEHPLAQRQELKSGGGAGRDSLRRLSPSQEKVSREFRL